MDIHLSNQTDYGLINYFRKTFSWMFTGVLVTFAVAAAFYVSNLWTVFYTNPAMVFLLLGAEIVIVLSLSLRINRMSIGTAKTMFIVYSVVNGITFASIFAVYEMSSIIFVFLIASGFFGTLALYGFVTKKDLTKWGPRLFAGLIGLLIFQLLSMFFNFQAVEKLFCILGLVLFMGMTAYDTQKIKDMYYGFSGNEEMLTKGSIFGALQLYLDFVNIFMYLLRLLGREKE